MSSRVPRSEGPRRRIPTKQQEYHFGVSSNQAELGSGDRVSMVGGERQVGARSNHHKWWVSWLTHHVDKNLMGEMRHLLMNEKHCWSSQGPIQHGHNSNTNRNEDLTSAISRGVSRYSFAEISTSRINDVFGYMYHHLRLTPW